MITALPYNPAGVQAAMSDELVDIYLSFGVRSVQYLIDSSWTYDIVEIESERILGRAGVQPLFEGCGQVWITPSVELLERYPLMFVKLVKANMFNLVKHGNLRRIQAVIDAEFQVGIRFAESFGFEREGVLRRYCPRGHDFVMYARLF